MYVFDIGTNRTNYNVKCVTDYLHNMDHSLNNSTLNLSKPRLNMFEP